MVNYDGLYRKDYFGDKLTFNHFSTKKLYFKIIENATILPFKYINVNGKGTSFGGLIDGNGAFVKDTLIHEGIGEVYTPNEEILNSPETVIFLGTAHSGINGWGHYLTDYVKRLWFLESDFYKKYFNNCKIVYNFPSGGVCSTTLLDFLKFWELILKN